MNLKSPFHSTLFLSVNLVVTSTQLMAETFHFYPLNGSSDHIATSVPSGYFTAVNQTVFDASRYYIPTKNLFNISGLGVLNLNEVYLIKIPWTFDNGYKSDLYSAMRSLDLGLGLIYNDASLTLELGFNNLVRLGGEVFEQPCIDLLLRTFHCGSGLPWADYQIPSQVPKPLAYLTITYKF